MPSRAPYLFFLNKSSFVDTLLPSFPPSQCRESVTQSRPLVAFEIPPPKASRTEMQFLLSSFFRKGHSSFGAFPVHLSLSLSLSLSETQHTNNARRPAVKGHNLGNCTFFWKEESRSLDGLKRIAHKAKLWPYRHGIGRTKSVAGLCSVYCNAHYWGLRSKKIKRPFSVHNPKVADEGLLCVQCVLVYEQRAFGGLAFVACAHQG